MAKILVVDDELDAPARRRLGNPGATGAHQFLFVGDAGEAARRWASDAEFPVALVAVGGRAGMEGFRRLRDTAPGLALIALAPGGDLAAIRRAMNEGARDFLTRPIDFEDLSRTVTRVLADVEERRRAREDARELATIRKELGIAEAIQQGILPGRFQGRDDLDIFAQMTPAREMGGDFYDFFEIGAETLGFVVADVAGKGVPAAFFMAVAHTLMRAATSTGAAPGDCLARVNTLLCRESIPGILVSVFYSILDTSTWELTYANGGHPPPFMIDGESGEVRHLEGGNGVVLGVEEGAVYEQASLTLFPGDTLFYYTDGLTEAFDPNRNQFTGERLAAALREGRDLTAEALAVTVFSALNAFTYGAPQHDDITSLVVKRL